jgi:hypothetical protein
MLQTLRHFKKTGRLEWAHVFQAAVRAARAFCDNVTQNCAFPPIRADDNDARRG